MKKKFVKKKPLRAAVLFLIFNRPDTTAEVFEKIRRAQPKRLYVAGDGPRRGFEKDINKVKCTRKIATAVDWPCTLETRFLKENSGCKHAVSDAISWFFKHEREGIIVEDDCLPSDSFFYFCEEMLNEYRTDPAVMAITGTNIRSKGGSESGYTFSRYALPWGWATWSHAWEKYDVGLGKWPSGQQGKHLVSLGIRGFLEKITWMGYLNLTKAGVIDTWDFQWIYSCWLHNGLTISPSRNLIRNIGFSESATHTKADNPKLSNLTLDELEYPLVTPRKKLANLEMDAFIAKNWFGADWRKIERILKNYLLSFEIVSRANHKKKRFFTLLKNKNRVLLFLLV